MKTAPRPRWFLLAALATAAGAAGCQRTAPQPMAGPTTNVVVPVPRPGAGAAAPAAALARSNQAPPPLTADPPQQDQPATPLKQQLAAARAAATPEPPPAPSTRALPLYVPTETPAPTAKEPLWKQRARTY